MECKKINGMNNTKSRKACTWRWQFCHVRLVISRNK